MFTWDQLRSIPSRCVNPHILLHGAGHSVPLVSAAIASAVEGMLREADAFASTKTGLQNGDHRRSGDGGSRAGDKFVSSSSRLTGVTKRSNPAIPMQSTDELEHDSLALAMTPTSPRAKASLAHLTGLRGVFIILVVILHFVPRPYENHGTTLFVDHVDVAKGWLVQDIA